MLNKRLLALYSQVFKVLNHFRGALSAKGMVKIVKKTVGFCTELAFVRSLARSERSV